MFSGYETPENSAALCFGCFVVCFNYQTSHFVGWMNARSCSNLTFWRQSASCVGLRGLVAATRAGALPTPPTVASARKCGLTRFMPCLHSQGMSDAPVSCKLDSNLSQTCFVVG